MKTVNAAEPAIEAAEWVPRKPRRRDVILPAIGHSLWKAGLFVRGIRIPVYRPRVTREFLMLLVQLASAFSILYGISFWSIPVALIIGGVGGILAMEMQTRRDHDDPKQNAVIRETINICLQRGQNPFDHPDVPLTQKWISYVATMRKPQ